MNDLGQHQYPDRIDEVSPDGSRVRVAPGRAGARTDPRTGTQKRNVRGDDAEVIVIETVCLIVAMLAYILLLACMDRYDE